MIERTTHYDAEALKRLHSISEVAVGLGIELKRAGEHLYRVKCPFHEDTNPSLLLDDSDGHFHCFGCGQHGDTLDLVMQLERLTFPEACARLAGIQPPTLQPRGRARERSQPRRWDRLTLTEQQVMDAAMALYSERLHDSARAVEYLHSRGITDRVISECRLGYADGYSLERYLSRHGMVSTALELGLLSERDPDTGRKHRTRYRERLAGRVVIPEIRHGSALWMIGRSISDDPHILKYIAMPGERPVLGMERAAGRDVVFAVEGPFDYLTGAKWGLPIFALCGVRMPQDRLGFLAAARTVYGVFDGDAAGRDANERFAHLLGDRFVPVALPSGTDLNELGKSRDGRDRFRELVRRAARGVTNG